jgi:hypothetical protein
MEICKICNEEFNLLKGLITHVNAKHSLNGREYYDTFLKKEGEGECSVCGNKTTYRNAGDGYLKTCSIECRSLSNEFREKQSKAKKGKKQSKKTIDKRVKNTNQKIKQKNWEVSNMLKYGVTNPTKLDSIKVKIGDAHRGIKKPRTDEWQRKIIESKKSNGTLKHSKKTKTKISDGLNKYFFENLDREKYICQSNNVSHLSGWYNGLYFRSSLELSFLVQNQNKSFSSCENDKYKIMYDDNGKQRVYYPDFTDGEVVYEIKPTGLLGTHINKLKIQEGIKIHGDNYKVITEIESPYIKKSLIRDLIDYGEVKLTNRAKKVLEKYKF